MTGLAIHRRYEIQSRDHTLFGRESKNETFLHRICSMVWIIVFPIKRGGWKYYFSTRSRRRNGKFPVNFGDRHCNHFYKITCNLVSKIAAANSKSTYRIATTTVAHFRNGKLIEKAVASVISVSKSEVAAAILKILNTTSIL